MKSKVVQQLRKRGPLLGLDAHGSISGQLRRRFGFCASSSLSSGVPTRFLVSRANGERRALPTRGSERPTSSSFHPEGISIATPLAFLTCKYPLRSRNAPLDMNHTVSSSSPSITTMEHVLSDVGRRQEGRGRAFAGFRRVENGSVKVDARLREESIDDLVLPVEDFPGLGARSERGDKSCGPGLSILCVIQEA